jgi:hypothetical protein
MRACRLPNALPPRPKHLNLPAVDALGSKTGGAWCMEDTRVWEFEESLWKADFEHYRESIDKGCLMVVPQPPHVLAGYEAIEAVSNTPRWTTVAFRKRTSHGRRKG